MKEVLDALQKLYDETGWKLGASDRGIFAYFIREKDDVYSEVDIEFNEKTMKYEVLK